jgi:hypothetical protein
MLFLQHKVPKREYAPTLTRPRVLQSFIGTYPNVLPQASLAVVGLLIISSLLLHPLPGPPLTRSMSVRQPTMRTTSSPKLSDLVGRDLLPFLGLAGAIKT